LVSSDGIHGLTSRSLVDVGEDTALGRLPLGESSLLERGVVAEGTPGLRGTGTEASAQSQSYNLRSVKADLDHDVVLEVVADREVDIHGNVEGREDRRGANTRKLENLGRTDSTGTGVSFVTAMSHT